MSKGQGVFLPSSLHFKEIMPIYLGEQSKWKENDSPSDMKRQY